MEEAVSPNLTTVDLLISLIGYTVVYGSLAVAMVYLMKKYAIAGPDAALHESVDVEPEAAASAKCCRLALKTKKRGITCLTNFSKPFGLS